MSDEDDDLKRLPPPSMDQLMTERVRRRAQALLAEEKRLMGRPLERRARRAWSRVMVPSLLAAACVVYLVWAVEFTAKIYGG